MDRINKKISTLENERTVPSVASPTVPHSIHMHALGGIYVAVLFYQVQMLVTKIYLDREKINLLESRLDVGVASFDLNYNYTAR